MSGTTSPTAAFIDGSGIHAPGFPEIQRYLQEQLQAIYGADIVLDADSQDGQLVGIFSLALADTNALAIAIYNCFSPATAVGIGLSSRVKMNGLARELPSNSLVPLVIVGEAGTQIINGVAQDTASVRWNLPPLVEIPPSGQVTVTATCAIPGAVTALPGNITRIATVTRGWQTVLNLLAASPGLPLETDALLRMRQSRSTALPALTVLQGVVGAVLALPDVEACRGYENDTNVTNAQGIPGHSIALVVQGGDPEAICRTILLKKTPGAFTYGTERYIVEDIYEIPHDIGYFIPTEVPVPVVIMLRALTGYTSLVAAAIRQAVADYINGLGSGVDVVHSKLWMPANLCGPDGMRQTATYDIQDLLIGIPPATLNIPISIFQVATCDPSAVTITIVP